MKYVLFGVGFVSTVAFLYAAFCAAKIILKRKERAR